jgi:hypothetical protein
VLARAGLAWLTLMAGCPRAAPPPAAPAPDSPPAAAVASHAAEPLAAAAAAPAAVDFATQVRPILEARCRPCHFPGGKMYAELPFDREATIERLGTRLFTRIRAPEEQRLISAFLEQRSAAPPP